MSEYAKLNKDGSLELFKGLSNRANPSEALIKERATQDGYKRIVQHTRAHHLTTLIYRATAKEIQAEWIEMDIEKARTQQLAALMVSCNRATDEAMSIHTSAEITLAQDRDASTVAIMAAVRGVDVATQTADIDRALAMGRVIHACLAGYYHQLKTRIESASTVTEIASIAWSRAYFTVVVEEAMAAAMKGGSDGDS